MTSSLVIWFAVGIVGALTILIIMRRAAVKREAEHDLDAQLQQWNELKTRHERINPEEREVQILGHLSQSAMVVESGAASPSEVDELIRRESRLFDPLIAERWFRMSDEEIVALGRGMRLLQSNPSAASSLEEDELFVAAVRIAKGAELER